MASLPKMNIYNPISAISQLDIIYFIEKSENIFLNNNKET